MAQTYMVKYHSINAMKALYHTPLRHVLFKALQEYLRRKTHG